MENGAGDQAFARDEDYRKADIPVSGRKDILSNASQILSINPIPEDELKLIDEGKVLCCVVNPAENRKWLELPVCRYDGACA